MEASVIRAPRLRGDVGGPTVGQRVGSGFAGPVRSILAEAAEIGTFFGRTMLELRGVWRYSSEIIRQAGILVTGSAAIICFMLFMMGVVCGTEANYVLRGYGATVYSGVFTSYCAIREMIPYMWGYILSAKVGCGLCAELGSMRIQDELDAMDSMGLDPMTYVVATRLVAVIICLPAFFFIVTGSYYLGNFIMLIGQIQEVSQGGWETVHWSFTGPGDQIASFLRLSLVGVMIALVGMFYGYRATGGPVGVGTATARSMILNLVLLHVVLMGLTALIWGAAPNAPVGG